MIDEIDLKIIQCLQENSRTEWKEIGQKIHMTGQAVAARVHKLEDVGIIEGYTLRVNQIQIGHPITALITVFMKTSSHDKFQNFLKTSELITEAHRVSGEGCYWLKVIAKDHAQLASFLDDILVFGNYRSSVSITKIK